MRLKSLGGVLRGAREKLPHAPGALLRLGCSPNCVVVYCPLRFPLCSYVLAETFRCGVKGCVRHSRESHPHEPHAYFILNQTLIASHTQKGGENVTKHPNAPLSCAKLSSKNE